MVKLNPGDPPVGYGSPVRMQVQSILHFGAATSAVAAAVAAFVSRRQRQHVIIQCVCAEAERIRDFLYDAFVIYV